MPPCAVAPSVNRTETVLLARAPGISFSGVSVTLIAPDWAEASDPALTTSVPLASCAALEPLPSARTATPSRRALPWVSAMPAARLPVVVMLPPCMSTLAGPEPDCGSKPSTEMPSAPAPAVSMRVCRSVTRPPCWADTPAARLLAVRSTVLTTSARAASPRTSTASVLAPSVDTVVPSSRTVPPGGKASSRPAPATTPAPSSPCTLTVPPCRVISLPGIYA